MEDDLPRVDKPAMTMRVDLFRVHNSSEQVTSHECHVTLRPVAT